VIIDMGENMVVENPLKDYIRKKFQVIYDHVDIIYFYFVLSIIITVIFCYCVCWLIAVSCGQLNVTYVGEII